MRLVGRDCGVEPVRFGQCNESVFAAVTDSWRLVEHDSTGPVSLDRRTDSTLSSVSVGAFVELADLNSGRYEDDIDSRLFAGEYQAESGEEADTDLFEPIEFLPEALARPETIELPSPVLSPAPAPAAAHVAVQLEPTVDAMPAPSAQPITRSSGGSPSGAGAGAASKTGALLQFLSLGDGGCDGTSASIVNSAGAGAGAHQP